jgi:hypothetical protein
MSFTGLLCTGGLGGRTGVAAAATAVVTVTLEGERAEETLDWRAATPIVATAAPSTDATINPSLRRDDGKPSGRRRSEAAEMRLGSTRAAATVGSLRSCPGAYTGAWAAE